MDSGNSTFKNFSDMGTDSILAKIVKLPKFYSTILGRLYNVLTKTQTYNKMLVRNWLDVSMLIECAK